MYQNQGTNSVHAATSLTNESFNNLLEFLNPGKDSCNIKFYDASSRLQAESQIFNDIGSPKSGRSHLARPFTRSTVTRYPNLAFKRSNR